MRAVGFENPKFKFKEPFKGLFTQGMVCHETYKDEKNKWYSPDEVTSENGKDYFLKSNKNLKVRVGPSESMSKSKKNTIDPEKMISQYGADAVRLFILSDSPPEKDVQWSDQGMLAAYKFIQKLFVLNEKIKLINKSGKIDQSLELSKFINQYLFKVERNLSNFHYNVIIANIYEAYTFFSNFIKDGKNYSNLIADYTKFLISISPVIPHFTSECLKQLKVENEIWPKINENFLIEENVNIVIQFNGKKRGILEVKKDIVEKELVLKILASKNFEKLLKDNKIKKQFYVKNRLINFII
tara:strand:- start:669 stop:1562 length:894 start_codon:yes stop_codon:yes gene_type:complete